MSRKASLYLVLGILFTVLFIGFTVCLKTADVKTVGPQGAKVGFSTLNTWVRDKIEVNEFFYKISQALGYISLAVCICFLCVGIYQFFTEKRGLKSIARGIWAVYGVYAVLALVYLLFDKVFIINYRPILENNLHLAPGYPSSHTMLSVCVFLSASDQIAKYAENKVYANILCVLCWVCGLGTVVSRFLSGVHWITDILGGLIISAAIICFYLAFCGEGEE